MQLPPFLLNLSRRARLAIASGIAVVLLLILLHGCHHEAPPQHVIVSLPQAEKNAEPVPVEPPGKSELILQLFNPSDQSLTHQLSTTVFTQQIEQAMTVSYVLTRCRLISQDDYTNTFRALISYAQQTKLASDEPTAEALVRKLADSASASYSLVYGRTPCDDPQLPVLAKQLAEWVQAVFSR